MKVFFYDHLPFLLIYVFNFVFLFFMYSFAGGFESNKIYFVFISLFVLVCFLVYRYLSHRMLYKKLTAEPKNLEEIMVDDQHTVLSRSIQKLLKEQYRLFQKEMHKKEKALKEHVLFMNQWVHQMKTPLSVLQLMAQDYEDEPFAPKMKEQLDKLNGGLNMALYMARLDTFEHDFRPEVIQLHSLVNQSVNSLKEFFIRKGVFPAVNVDKAAIVQSDEKWLSFMLQQLLSNAIRYSGEPNKRVYISGYVQNHNTILEVKDEGVGIPKKDIRRVFDPFYTGENGRQFRESTGMGLYILKKVCDKLGHEVQIESAVGKGTTVKIVFHAAKNSFLPSNLTEM
ncbi:signal transduction histidine kinase [Scopulibacillus daqui]|uniref:histidine kinase n=1 Tax=Scopulibacillus daqui TaxID=1469162 RepID=A0ABS2PZL0_9BACL|nr:sensor histidine kinase [Scopulibacillus daqui]MBM7645477.1 signal transduction histidine kinase [Scopulibacillus daqui]